MSRRRGQPAPEGWSDVSLTFGGRELVDLAVAWAALSLAFAVFFEGGGLAFVMGDPLAMLAISGVTAGVGFLLHELAHKVTAVRFDTPAVFRADYGMLGLAIVAALAGFLFAAPGAVHHPRTANARQQGLIALAGPGVNLALAGVFVPLLVAPVDVLATIGFYGLLVNVVLAGFNMLPFGPLDGRKVLAWSKPVFVVSFVGTVAPAAAVIWVLFL